MTAHELVRVPTKCGRALLHAAAWVWARVYYCLYFIVNSGEGHYPPQPLNDKDGNPYFDKNGNPMYITEGGIYDCYDKNGNFLEEVIIHLE